MQPPRWDDPIGSAIAEATRTVERGLQVRPTLYGFEDGEPTVRVRVGLRTSAAGPGAVAGELLGLVAQLDLRQVLLFSHVRTTDSEVADEHLRAALATFGIVVEVGERTGRSVTTTAHLIDRAVVDGEVRWEEPIVLDGGLWGPSLARALDPSFELPGAPSVGTWGYALSRRGTVVEVAPGWRHRFGFDRVPPRLVRSEDRWRARRLERMAGQDGRMSA